MRKCHAKVLVLACKAGEDLWATRAYDARAELLREFGEEG